MNDDCLPFVIAGDQQLAYPRNIVVEKLVTIATFDFPAEAEK